MKERDNVDLVSISIKIPKKDKNKMRIKLIPMGITQQELVRQLISDWVSDKLEKVE